MFILEDILYWVWIEIGKLLKRLLFVGWYLLLFAEKHFNFLYMRQKMVFTKKNVFS